jgi:long-chain acyl-CoA synthetase
VRILDEQGEDVGPGQPGHVYLKLGRAMGPSPLPGFASVGDLGYLDGEDYLFLIGRSDAVIVTGGVNVHPEQVETVLAAHPEVVDVAVVGVPDPDWGQRVEALIRPRSAAIGDLVEDLKAYARANLAAAQRPRAFHVVDSLPRDANGKLRRRELRAE